MSNIEYGFDRRKFLLQIVGQFNTKIGIVNPERDKMMMERVYNQMLTALEKQKKPSNQMDITEKIRILKECYRNFKSDAFREGLKGKSPKKIAQDFGEEMLGIFKRQYDMSSMFSPGLIGSRKLPDGKMKKMVGVKPLADNDERTIVDIEEDMNITIQQIGELIYSDGIDIINDIKQYVITLLDKNGKTIEKTVFTNNIDLNLLSNDTNYAKAVFTELLNINNIEHSNAGGYIGEIVPSKKMIPGEERMDESGFYSYQINTDYAITYDPIAVSAAKIIEKRAQEKKQEWR